MSLPLLKHKEVLIINTTFFTEEKYKRTGGKDPMEKITVDGSLKYPGIEDAQQVFFYSVWAVGHNKRLEYLETAYRLGKEF